MLCYYNCIIKKYFEIKMSIPKLSNESPLKVQRERERILRWYHKKGMTYPRCQMLESLSFGQIILELTY
jgi:hypothetical protein